MQGEWVGEKFVTIEDLHEFVCEEGDARIRTLRGAEWHAEKFGHEVKMVARRRN